jgi:hypothetical protein
MFCSNNLTVNLTLLRTGSKKLDRQASQMVCVYRLSRSAELFLHNAELKQNPEILTLSRIKLATEATRKEHIYITESNNTSPLVL